MTVLSEFITEDCVYMNTLTDAQPGHLDKLVLRLPSEWCWCRCVGLHTICSCMSGWVGVGAVQLGLDLMVRIP